MTDETNKVVEVAQAVAAVVEKVPVYQDAVQPAAQEVGKSLQLVAKAVGAALSPLEAFVWGVDQVREFVRSRVATKLRSVPPEDILQPEAQIAVPAIEALRYVGPKEELSEMYANLLATSMDKQTATRAHPAFVEMIKNMNPDEARILKHLSTNSTYPLIDIKRVEKSTRSFVVTHRHISLIGMDAHCAHTHLAPNYLDNLMRLGLVEFPESGYISDKTAYARIEDFPEIKKIVDDMNRSETHRAEVQKLRVCVTDLGKQFIRACVIDKDVQPRT